MSEKEDKDIGFSGIGKRIENLKDDVSSKDTTTTTQIKKVRQHTKSNSVKQQTAEVYTSTIKQKVRPSFKLSFGKVFWGIVAIVIIASIFSQNNDKKKINDTPSSNIPSQHSAQSFFDDDIVTKGRYRCSSYHNNKADRLKPSAFEEQEIKRLQNILESEGNKLARLKTKIDTTYVDNYSQESVDRYNLLVDNYNSRLEMYKANYRDFERKVESYDAKVNKYNNYLIANCRKAY